MENAYWARLIQGVDDLGKEQGWFFPAPIARLFFAAGTGHFANALPERCARMNKL
jgi:hypothetical protein